MGKPTPGPYDPAFRARAVALVRSSGLSNAQVARDLGVNPATLRLWGIHVEIDTGQRAGVTTEEKVELTHLRREVAVLTQVREILKKAAALFAWERAM